MADDDLGRMWSAYTNARLAEGLCRQAGHPTDRTPVLAARNDLVVRYQSLVDHIVRQLAANLPQLVDPGDLTAYGNIGLIDAIEKFEPSRNFKFESYAMGRIRGGIIDEIRRVDVVPRSVRLQSSRLRSAIHRLQRTLSRQPTNAEVAALLGVTEQQVRDMSAADSAYLVPFKSESDDDTPDRHTAEPAAVDDFDPDIFSLRRSVADAIGTLPYRERAILALYYRDRLSFDDIRVLLDVAVGRISQVHTGALRQLRRAIAGPLLDDFLEAGS